MTIETRPSTPLPENLPGSPLSPLERHSEVAGVPLPHRLPGWGPPSLSAPPAPPTLPTPLVELPPPEAEGMGTRLRQHLRVPMFRNAYALIGSTVLMTGLGMLAMIAAARLYSTEDMGRGQSAVNALIVLGGLGNLRLMNVLTRFLPRAGERSAWLVSRCYALVIAASVVACVVYLTAFRSVLPVEDLMGDTPFAGLWFSLAVVAFALFTVQDAVLTGLRQATWVPLKNGVHGLVKLVLVVAFAGSLPTTGILASWAIPTLLALIPVNLLIARKLLPANARRDVRPEDLSPRRLAPFAAGEYAGALCELAVANLIPVIVALQLGWDAAGVFAVAWLIGTTLDHIVMHFGSSLTVEGASDPSRFPALTRQLLGRSAAVIAPISLVVVVGSPFVMKVFGPQYETHASGLLSLLGLALLPRLVCIVAVVVARVRGDIARVVGVQAFLAAGSLVGSFALLGPVGVAGPGIAYLTTSLVVCAVVAPGVVRSLHTPRHLLASSALDPT
jgi:O-antigen/teichoic acid export membrane protein